MTDQSEPKKSISLKVGEINALKKAILYLKFSCEDAGADIFASSSLINSAFESLLEASDLGEMELKFYQKGNEVNEGYVISRVNQMEARDGDVMSEDFKMRVCEAWMYPFRLTNNFAK
ncbi:MULTISPECIES: hypothetical protein [Burkholderia]|uniref:hypothetical protein n=1 Tax=Burkholderia TaxID=32008 RepID=UPI00064F72DB|nr:MULTISPECIES: hypothetical protein [Burkholderia]KML18878.1 hypothetical protein VL00_08470 [Burkholderia cepacia]KMN62165.1 hypothetical protein VK92_03680 [Burkholderia sp. LK4]KWF91424.1 hypothetical protein WL94_13655 [Burkholderia cepacia]